MPARLAGERRIALATSKPTVYAETILRHFGLRGHFAAVVGSEMDGRRTAKADVVRAALLAVPGHRRALMVGDREHDIQGARANAIPALGVAYGYGTPEELPAAGPLGIVSTVADLAAFFEEH